MSSNNNETSLNDKLLKAQKWSRRLFLLHDLSKSIRKDFTNYNELKEQIRIIEETIKKLEDHLSQIEDDNNDIDKNYKEDLIIIIENLKNERQYLIQQKTLFPNETAKTAITYSGSVLGGTAATIMLTTPSGLGIFLGSFLGGKLADKTYNFCYDLFIRKK